jgi:hypothetical protein
MHPEERQTPEHKRGGGRTAPASRIEAWPWTGTKLGQAQRTGDQVTVRFQDEQGERKRTARREAINGCSLSRSRGRQNDEEPLGEAEVVACPHSPLLRVLASICGRNEPHSNLSPSSTPELGSRSLLIPGRQFLIVRSITFIGITALPKHPRAGGRHQFYRI